MAVGACGVAVTEIRKHAPTAVVTLDLRTGAPLVFGRLTERVTPLQVVRSGWVNDTNDLSDDERVIVQVAIERVVRRERGVQRPRPVKITPYTDFTWWAGWVRNWGEYGSAGRWEMADGEVCMAEVRRLL